MGIQTEGCSKWCLENVSASSDPATEDPDRDVDRPVEVVSGWIACMGAVTGSRVTVGPWLSRGPGSSGWLMDPR